MLGALAGGGVFLALSGRNDDKNDASQSQGTGEDTGDQGPAASDPDVLNSVRAVARTDPYGVNLPATLGVRPTTVGQRPAPRRARGRALLRSVGQTRVTGSGEDPRTTELRAAVARLRRELAGHPPEFPDRDIAEDELAVLAAMVAAGDPEVPRMRRSLLLIAGAIGSVSALAPALMQVRNAMDLFGEVPR